MENKTKYYIAGAIILAIIFIAESLAIKDTKYIWLQTRTFGLLSFLGVFLTIALGEMRLIRKSCGGFGTFKHHKKIAIASAALVFIHMVSAIADNYKWGKQLSFVQYLGFTFTDKWMFWLSLGTLSFYLILIVAGLSQTKIIQKLTFKKWKLTHYLSYGAFVIAYIHAINLGTDIKISALSPYLYPLIQLMFLLTIALLITRMLCSHSIFSDKTETNLATVFFLLLLILSLSIASQIEKRQQYISDLTNNISEAQDAITTYEKKITKISTEISNIRSDLVKTPISNQTQTTTTEQTTPTEGTNLPVTQGGYYGEDD
jgi:hypothetical protein